MLLFFGCRVSELRLAKKSDFDFKKHVWHIPTTNHKTGQKGKAIVRPLNPQVEKLMKGAFALSPDDCEYALPNNWGKIHTIGQRISDNDTISHQY